MKMKIKAAIAAMLLAANAQAATENQWSYASNGFSELANWTIEDGKIVNSSVCSYESEDNQRFMACLDGAREIFAYECLMKANDKYCNAYREISSNPAFIQHRKSVNSAPFSPEAKKIDKGL